MSTDNLYSELKDDLSAVANQLLDLSMKSLEKRGNFLPHGAWLDANGKVGLVMAAPENEITNSTEVLPLLHEALRDSAKTKDLAAIGVAENVTITPNGKPTTDAIKVLFEHKRGLVVALYLPFKKKFLRGYSYGEAFTVTVQKEVNAWPETPTQ
jgi:hypothetical protein